MNYRSILLLQLTVSCIVLSGGAFASFQSFEEITAYPTPAPGSYFVVGTALPDGRLLVWNGNDVYLQQFSNANKYAVIAHGFIGDPGFLTLSPNGHTVLMGAGYSGKLYVLDLNAPADYSAANDIAVISHYAAAFLTENLVLIDRGTSDWATSELGIVDISHPTPVFRLIMEKPARASLPPNASGSAAAIAVSQDGSTVYLMDYLYDNMTYASLGNQLKSIPATTIMQAYANQTLLDWSGDAVSIGTPSQYPGGGPSAVTNAGNLIIGGFGNFQEINPATGAVLNTYAPAGFTYYTVIYNSARGEVVAMADGKAYGDPESSEPMPLLEGTGIALLAASLSLSAARMVRR